MTAMETDDRPAQENFGVMWFLRQCTIWMLLLTMLALLLLSVVLPKVVDGRALVVATSSMSPTYPPGTLIVVRNVDPPALKVGDTITYQIWSEKAVLNTHRIVGFTFDEYGNRLFATQGDAVAFPDVRPVQADQIVGRVWYSIPVLGYVAYRFSGRYTILTVVTLLFLYACKQLVEGRREYLEQVDNRSEMRL